MFTALVILAVFLQTAIALGVYFRRKGGQAYTFFMLLSLSLAGWALTNYFAITISQNQSTIYAIRTVLSLAVIQNTLFFFFAKTYPDKKLTSFPKLAKAIAAYSLLILILTQTPLIFSNVLIKNNNANPNPKPIIVFFILHAVLTISLGLKSLFHKHRLSTNLQKRQLSFVIVASIILWVIVPITNFVITLSAKTTFFVKISPFYTLAFGAFITYAIVAQKLFDIRSAVARSVAYVLTIASIAVIYTLSIFLFFGLFGGLHASRNIQQPLYLAIAIFLGITFMPLKRFFDRTTNKLFYRDAYEPQALLDALNKVLVSSIELNELLSKTSRVIGDTLKVDFCAFAIKETNNSPRRVIGTSRKEFSNEDIKIVRGITPKMHTQVIITDELGNSYHHLQEILRHYDIALMGRLTEKPNKEVEGIGYMILGFKKSGNPYSKQDIKILEIINDELVIAIQNSLRFEEIQNFAKTLEQKVDMATRELRRTNEKLKQLDQTKDDFISMASHQLRTPLTSVKGYVSMVLEGDAGKVGKQQRKLLDQAFISSQRMVYLIADLLNVSRLKTGKFIIEPKPTNLAEVVEGELSQLTETAKGRNLTMRYDKPKEFPALMLDDTKIRQVIMNFADNAIYYTPSGGHITISLLDKPEVVEFTVSDDGIGVPKAEQHHLFNKFYRAGNAKKARPDGTGLGLFMAKKVVIAQGGSIIFNSQEGKGSTFGFSFAKKPLLPENFKGPLPAETETTK